MAFANMNNKINGIDNVFYSCENININKETMNKIFNYRPQKYIISYDENEKKEVDGFNVYRIYAIENFTTINGKEIRAGDRGGWVESRNNLSDYGKSWIDDEAVVYHLARVIDDAVVYGNAIVNDIARIKENAQVYENAKISGRAVIKGNSKIYNNAHVDGMAYITDNSQIYGNANIYDEAEIYDNTQICGNMNVNGKSVICGANNKNYRFTRKHFFQSYKNVLKNRMKERHQQCTQYHIDVLNKLIDAVCQVPAKKIFLNYAADADAITIYAEINNGLSAVLLRAWDVIKQKNLVSISILNLNKRHKMELIYQVSDNLSDLKENFKKVLNNNI